VANGGAQKGGTLSMRQRGWGKRSIRTASASPFAAGGAKGAGTVTFLVCASMGVGTGKMKGRGAKKRPGVLTGGTNEGGRVQY
jgi:hypothetical protein